MTFAKIQKFRNTSFVSQRWLLSMKVKIVNIGSGVTQQNKAS